MNTRVLKEPLGFIRVIEFPMAILAFATTVGYSASAVLTFPCGQPNNKTQTLSWSYSFALTHLTLPGDLCTGAEDDGNRYPFGTGAVSQSQFFVFVGVVCFFYILAILAVYLFAWPKYENDGRMPLADFVMTALLAFFWFVSSCAWASGVNTVKSETDREHIVDTLTSPSGPKPCNSTQEKPNCSIDANSHWNYASLNVSLIAGFACFALWVANLWFIYKETPWYKARTAMTTPSTGQGFGTSAGPSPTGANTFR